MDLKMLQQKQVRAYPLELKLSEDKSGQFEGYGSIFGNVDSYNEVVAPGAFEESLQEKMPALLWQHKADCPIGIFTHAEEDSKGLFVKGELNLDTQQGKETYSLLKQKALKGMSIGYRVLAYEKDEEESTLTLTKLDLWEVSIVTFPANTLANVTGVKNLPGTEREFERFLREAGFPKTMATAIATKGFKPEMFNRRDSEDVSELMGSIGNLIEQLRG